MEQIAAMMRDNDLEGRCSTKSTSVPDRDLNTVEISIGEVKKLLASLDNRDGMERSPAGPDVPLPSFAVSSWSSTSIRFFRAICHFNPLYLEGGICLFRGAAFGSVFV